MITLTILGIITISVALFAIVLITTAGIMGLIVGGDLIVALAIIWFVFFRKWR